MRRLLISEDEELFRRELETTVPWADWGFVLVGAAEDGAQAWDLLRSRRAEAVLTDVRMPLVDGIELMRKASDLPLPERPLFVIVSGYADFRYAQEAVRLGAFDYLLKPVEDEALEGTMRRAAAELESRDARDGLLRSSASDPVLAFFRNYLPGRTREPGDAYVEAAVEEISARYLSDLTVDAAAGRLGISGDHLARIFKRRTGYTFNEYLTRFRIQRAVELLRDPSVRVGEVADLCGYRDPRYFSVLFRRLVGMTPSEFRSGRGRPPSR
ncbi:MAG TPA: helix-turn-helix domain-containing protein [Spirochaetia bacterium]|nr:helix-turn-helix domain-containing protein [Spirochaetales bacterium]HRY80209.1 helix-turn-helix domain-containing protein [Spirochaetia bacterium]